MIKCLCLKYVECEYHLKQPLAHGISCNAQFPPRSTLHMGAGMPELHQLAYKKCVII